jgi:hypothetical protein
VSVSSVQVPADPPDRAWFVDGPPGLGNVRSPGRRGRVNRLLFDVGRHRFSGIATMISVTEHR